MNLRKSYYVYKVDEIHIVIVHVRICPVVNFSGHRTINAFLKVTLKT